MSKISGDTNVLGTVYILHAEVVQIKKIISFDSATFEHVLRRWLRDGSNPHGLYRAEIEAIYNALRQFIVDRKLQIDTITEDAFNRLKAVQIRFDKRILNSHFIIITNGDYMNYARYSFRP